jgi:secretion/DNA translocation related TadE-like protein
VTRLPTDLDRGRSGDRGVATVWAATAVAVLITVLVGALDVVGAVAARHRAEAAADLAALAAATQAARGTTAACARAGDVAAGSGGRMVLCRLQGWEAVVEVELAVPSSLVGAGRAHGRARAGPVAAQPPVPVFVRGPAPDHRQ